MLPVNYSMPISNNKLIIIGTGASATFTLLNLSKKNVNLPSKICIFESQDNFGQGYPYKDSSPHYFMNNTVFDLSFIPTDIPFGQYIKDNLNNFINLTKNKFDALKNKVI